jgi:copper transporter 1
MYTLACIIIFIFAACYEGYQILHLKTLEWISQQKSANEAPTLNQKAIDAVLRIAVRVFGACWSYLLMLIVMTFNIGLFLAVIFGLGIGSAIFGPYLSRLEARRLVEFQTDELCC